MFHLRDGEKRHAPKISIIAYLCCFLIISMSFVGITFSKYVSTKSGSSSAQVAKFDVNIDISQGDFSVEGSTAPDVALLPGSGGELMSFNVTGTSEVSVEVIYDAEITFDGWELLDGTEYCPVIITVNGTNYSMDGVNIKTIAELKAAVEGAIEGYHESYRPGVALDNELNVSWSWPFVGDNAKDTELCELNVSPTIVLSISCTGRQID